MLVSSPVKHTASVEHLIEIGHFLCKLNHKSQILKQQILFFREFYYFLPCPWCRFVAVR